MEKKEDVGQISASEQVSCRNKMTKDKFLKFKQLGLFEP